MTVIDGLSSSYQDTAKGSDKSDIIGKDEFFKMLIAQLKNQDPLNPLEGTAFAAQLAQFASLEQLTNLNAALALQNASNAVSINALSVNLIGKEITAPANDGSENVITGRVTAVSFKGNEIFLTVEGQEIAFKDVTTVK